MNKEIQPADETRLERAFRFYHDNAIKAAKMKDYEFVEKAQDILDELSISLGFDDGCEEPYRAEALIEILRKEFKKYALNTYVSRQVKELKRAYEDHLRFSTHLPIGTISDIVARLESCA